MRRLRPTWYPSFTLLGLLVQCGRNWRFRDTESRACSAHCGGLKTANGEWKTTMSRVPWGICTRSQHRH
ncbi:hypothetical protein JG687_00002507 [Phytophthora cactorum]|uniref:Uncharacterized protein n=1 Tax=Phytophthora cactorum TaxID=29920 RepID=A0A8T1UY66_9STRA|nr:hypothetical protein JG687_00002507 [Phytophthora cactorum]